MTGWNFLADWPCRPFHEKFALIFFNDDTTFSVFESDAALHIDIERWIIQGWSRESGPRAAVFGSSGLRYRFTPEGDVQATQVIAANDLLARLNEHFEGPPFDSLESATGSLFAECRDRHDAWKAGAPRRARNRAAICIALLGLAALVLWLVL